VQVGNHAISLVVKMEFQLPLVASACAGLGPGWEISGKSPDISARGKELKRYGGEGEQMR
jgi:hypothetical protein